jgi:hypothetical protein
VVGELAGVGMSILLGGSYVITSARVQRSCRGAFPGTCEDSHQLKCSFDHRYCLMLWDLVLCFLVCHNSGRDENGVACLEIYC